jgi:outer membrane receptor protein involved in Fe transport
MRPAQRNKTVSAAKVLSFRAPAIGTDGWHCFTAARRLLSLALLLLIAGTSPAQAQETRVEGIVRDTSGASIPGAKVELHAKSYSASTVTDTSGNFAFANVPGTSGTLVITAKDFQQVQQNWSAASLSPAHIDVVLNPSPLNQQIVVTAARTATPLGETPVSDIQLSRDDLQATPALTLDDSLRQIPGFSLFRRSSSRVANPTTMGVSLRGLGSGSGTSRALVLEDGIPLNDPFGAWIYWDRVPSESISSVEVAEEGASSLYGSDALGGVIQFLTRPAQPSGISIETSYGNQNTPNLSLWAGGEKGGWESAFGGEVFHTDGYILVPESQRGSIDRKAGSENGTADLMIGRKIGSRSEIFARGWFLDDRRQNGTPDQTNNIRMGEGALGANLQLGSAGAFTLRFYGDAQSYHQGFSSVATNRNSETLTDLQAVPAQGVGGSAVWTRALGKRETLVAGLDEHEEIGHSNEMLSSGVTGVRTFDTFAGGHQRTVGVFGEDLIQLAPGWTLEASARFDDWRNFDAFRVQQPVSPAGAPVGSPSSTFYADRSYDAFSPRLSLVHAMNSHVSWSASVYRAFRAPTLNELYRQFRQGTQTTDANPFLRAERLTGTEAGVDVKGLDQRLEFRGVFFYNQVVDPVTNVPCTATTPNCVLASTGTTQIRENLGRTTSPGVALNGFANITSHFQLSAGYQYVNATVVSAPGLGLAWLWAAQIPHHEITFQARYSDPKHITFSVDGRMVGVQFDDAANHFPMGRFFVMDTMVSRGVGGGLEVFAAAENLLNERFLIAAQGGQQLGLPIAARFGFRFDFPGR